MNTPDKPANLKESPAGSSSDSGQNPLSEKLEEVQSGEHEPESTLWIGRYSARAMVGLWFLGIVEAIIILGGLIYLSTVYDDFSWSGWPAIIGLSLLGISWIYLLVLLAYRVLAFEYELTSQRLIHRRGIVFRKTERIEIIDMRDLSVSQNLLERMVNVGNIKLESSDSSDPELLVFGIHDCEEVADIFDKARIKERRKRGIQIR
ncbi:MAG: PH domain-containing protein [Pirellulaceae bacterium]|nr:PH domain-containing protein [Pirellulaceae bacterium]